MVVLYNWMRCPSHQVQARLVEVLNFLSMQTSMYDFNVSLVHNIFNKSTFQYEVMFIMYGLWLMSGPLSFNISRLIT
jgi:hypothetical protein